jgi:hypothetical protein
VLEILPANERGSPRCRPTGHVCDEYSSLAARSILAAAIFDRWHDGESSAGSKDLPTPTIQHRRPTATASTAVPIKLSPTPTWRQPWHWARLGWAGRKQMKNFVASLVRYWMRRRKTRDQPRTGSPQRGAGQ